jgi:hypothetical protein
VTRCIINFPDTRPSRIWAVQKQVDDIVLGLTTDLSVNDIETILLSNNFEIKR